MDSSKTSGMIPEMNPNPDHSILWFGQRGRLARRLPGYDIGNALVAKGWNTEEEMSVLSTAAKKPRKAVKGVIDAQKDENSGRSEVLVCRCIE